MKLLSERGTRMFSHIWIQIVLFEVSLRCVTVPAMNLYNITSCEQFEEDAHFDPTRVIDAQWKIFYFWSNTTEVNPIIFSLLSKKSLKRFRNIIEAIEPSMSVEWHKATFSMEPRPGVEIVLLSGGSSGVYRGIVKMEMRQEVRPRPVRIGFADLRFKLKGRYVGLMCCEDFTAFALARLDEVPATEGECVAAAATLGLQGPGGRSHLYLHKMLHSEL